MCVVNKIQQNLQTLNVGSANSEKLKECFYTICKLDICSKTTTQIVHLEENTAGKINSMHISSALELHA